MAQPAARRQGLIYLLVLLLGLAGGFAGASFLGDDSEPLPDPDLVFYESADVAFPVAGARFTDSTYDESKRECDKELLKRLLRADPRRFEAWLDLQGITEDRFDAFVDGLTTKILDEPTPVTNHGCFAEGEGECPFSIQSVLGPGTAVWVDDTGRIVAKCACSNPIKEPRCPPNCEEIPTPTPSPTPTPTRTPVRTAPPTPTPPPRTPTPTPEPTPTPTPIRTPTPQPTLQPPT